MVRMNRGMAWALAAALPALVIVSAGEARAGEAVVVVETPPPPPPPPPPRYSEPPPIATSPVMAPPPDDYDARPELYRSPFRLHVGPSAITTGQGLGMGLGLAADMGRGSVGFRLAAAWLRGEPAGGQAPSVLADGLSQYTGELTIDLFKRGPWHPVLGFGAGIARASVNGQNGTIGIGTAGLRLEYAFALDDADVRIGLGASGILAGPSDREVKDIHSYALLGASLGVGF